MAKTRTQQPQIRKSVLVFGGVVLGVALLGFVLTTFVGRGGGGDPSPPPLSTGGSQASTVTPKPEAPKAPGLRQGGRDPFRPAVNTQAAPAPAPAPDPAEPATAVSTPSNLQYMMLYKVVFNGQAVYMQYDDSGQRQLLGVADQTANGYVVETIGGDCATFRKEDKTIRLCTGQKAPV